VPLRSDPIKYEFDESAGAIVVHRFLYTTMFYPCNYGFIPHTLAEDGDAVDVMVMGRIPVLPGRRAARATGRRAADAGRGGAGGQNPGGATQQDLALRERVQT
jgi:inorganic pyrophosphatase